MLISAMPSLGDKVTCISLQIDSDVGFRTLRMDVDNFSGYSGSKPELYYRFESSASGIAQSLACTRKLGISRSSEELRSFNP